MANDSTETTRWLTRLEADAREREARIRMLENIVSRLPDIEQDVARTTENCQKIREWVEKRDEQKEALTAGQRVAMITGAFALAAAFIALIGTLIAAGVIG